MNDEPEVGSSCRILTRRCTEIIALKNRKQPYRNLKKEMKNL